MERTHSADFTFDRENSKLSVKKIFSATLERVWEAWTRREILDQWWAPKPWKAVTKAMDFREGGDWLYRMEGPGGEVSWSKSTYKTIDPLHYYESEDTFCDENGKEDPEFPVFYWKTTFTPMQQETLVTVDIAFDNVSGFDKIIETGFEEGFTEGLRNLDVYFEKYS